MNESDRDGGAPTVGSDGAADRASVPVPIPRPPDVDEQLGLLPSHYRLSMRLLAAGIPELEVARKCKIQVKTVREYRKRSKSILRKAGYERFGVLKLSYESAKHAFAAQELRKDISTSSMRKLIGSAAYKILQEIHSNPEKIQDAPLPALAKAFETLFDKMRVLEGEPTNIVSVEDRRSLNELIRAMNEEARRRGMAVDLHPSPDGVYREHVGESS